MTQRPRFDVLWASKGDVTDPQAKYVEGWLDKEKPKHQHQNFLQQREEEFDLSHAEDGVPYLREWVAYKEGSLSKQGTEVLVYKKGKWEKSIGYKGLTELAQEIRAIDAKNIKHGADYSNPHKVTYTQVGGYSKTQIDAKIKVLDDDILTHVRRVDNPHKLTAQLIGLVPSIGGTFEWVHTNQYRFGLNSNTWLFTAEEAVFLLKSGAWRAIGINKYNDAGVWEGRSDAFSYLIYDGNYVSRRLPLEPFYALPEPTSVWNLSLSLDVWYSDSLLETDWDGMVFEPLGLKLAGKVTISNLNQFLSETMTVSCRPSGVVELMLGDISLSSTANTLTVKEGNTVMWSGAYKAGDILTYSRDKTDGSVYLNGVQVESKVHGNTYLPPAGYFQGTGNIKGIQVWSQTLTKEQCSNIG